MICDNCKKELKEGCLLLRTGIFCNMDCVREYNNKESD